MVMEMAMVNVMRVCTRECESCARIRACSRARARRGDRAAEAANSATVAKGG
jgi:hypothetical protein